MRAALATCALVVAFTRVATAETAFERGVARFRADDWAGSIDPLERAHAEDPRDADAALLLGIAYYHTHRVAAAQPLLQQAERSGDEDTRASARVFLGLIADERGDNARARRYFDQVARSSTSIAASGQRLLDGGAPERWSIAAIVRPGFDSNVPLVATSARPGDGAADADVTVVGALAVRPFASVPLVLDETASYRREARLHDFDAASDTVGATYTYARRADLAELAYHFEASTLGSSVFELGHVADAHVRHAFDAFAVGARYQLGVRSFEQDAYAGYTGVSHTGIAEVGWGAPSSRGELVLGYVIARDITDDDMLTATGQGGEVAVRFGQLRASVVALDRVFDRGRRDIHVHGDASYYLELARERGLVFGGTLLDNTSTESGQGYVKWRMYAGFVIGASR